MQLSELIKDIEGINVTGTTDEVEVTNITNDSRNCNKGSLFVAYKGHEDDGKNFIKHALKNGAVAVLTDGAVEGELKVPLLEVTDTNAVLAQVAERFYGDAPENILAVTGTNGKSSVVHFVREILAKLGHKVGSIGTLGVVTVDGERQRGNLTTPDILHLRESMANLKKQGATHVVMEASSHGLQQERMAGLMPKVAGFTTFSHEHLDYHGTLEHYFDAKLKLFVELMEKGTAVLNADIEEFDKIKKSCKGHKVLTYGSKGETKLKDIKAELGGMKIDLESGGKKFSIHSALVGDFQAENLLCAISMVEALGIEIKDIVKACDGIASVKGRMDVVAYTPLGAPVVVDYAHTADALEKVLVSLRPHLKGKLVVVFGCGGERDKEKRPEMGKIASEFADVVIITDDNPRMESSDNIRKEVLEGCNKDATEIGNRKEAIFNAVNLLEKDDLLLIAGKGHEDYQLVGRRKYRFDDAEMTRRAIGSPLWSAKDTLKATGGKSDAKDWTAYGVSIDTRTMRKGDLFVAIKGDNFDGHNFVKEALEKGAAAAIVQKNITGLEKNAAIVKVTNTLKALEDMAAFRRKESTAKIIAITGSVGKTSVKDATSVILGYQGKTHSTQNNLNNHIGLPLSLARLPLDAEYGVFELGMSKKGEIAKLSKLLRPHVAVVTAIEAVHLENFDSIVDIADAKAEIFTGLEKDGVAVVPYDSSMLTRLASKAHDNKIDKILSFGVGEFAKYRLTGGREYSDGVKLVADCDGLELKFKISLLGRHHALNTMAVLAALDAIGANLRQAARTYIKVRASQGRGRIHRLKIDGNRITLIDDSYNASPASMKAALDVLGTIGFDSRGRLVAVLGDMLELGNDAAQYHSSLAQLVEKNKINVVYTAGELMNELHENLPDSVEKEHVKSANDLLPIIKEHSRRGDTILFKGSHGSNIWQVADKIKEESR